MTLLGTRNGFILGLLIVAGLAPLGSANGGCVDEELENFCVWTVDEDDGDCTEGGFGHERAALTVAVVSALTVSSYCDSDESPRVTRHEGISVRLHRENPGPDVGFKWENCESDDCSAACEQYLWAHWLFFTFINTSMPCAGGLEPVTLQQLLP